MEEGIPEQFFEELFYVDKFQEWVNKQKPTFENDKYEHGRIIIPLVRDGSWYGFQGRSLNPNDTMRYITIILDETQPKSMVLIAQTRTKLHTSLKAPLIVFS